MQKQSFCIILTSRNIGLTAGVGIVKPRTTTYNDTPYALQRHALRPTSAGLKKKRSWEAILQHIWAAKKDD